MATILEDKIYLNMTNLTYLRFGNPLVPQTHRTTTDDSAFRGNEIHDGQCHLPRKLNPWWSKPSESATISIAHSIQARKYIEPVIYGPRFRIHHDAGRECATSSRTWWSSWLYFILSLPNYGGLSLLLSLWATTSAILCPWRNIITADPVLTNDGSSRLLRDEPFSVPLQSVHVLVQKNWLSHDNQSLLTLII